MRVLTLRHKGYSLKVAFKAGFYYTETVFEPGKTLYQILFEHLIDGKIVSCRGLARHYEKLNPDINPSAIQQMLGRIGAAAKKSKNSKLRKMRFKRLPRGGASTVISRKNISSRFTHAQREVIDKTIKGLHKPGKLPRHADIRVVCLAALRKKDLDANVVLSDVSIYRAKKRLDLPIRSDPKPRFGQAQRKVIEQTIRTLCKEGSAPTYVYIRQACLQALREKGLAQNIALADVSIYRAKKRLGLPIRKRQAARRPRRRR